MSSTPLFLSGPPIPWEGESLAALQPYERIYARCIPPLELRSQVLQRLNRAKISGYEHIGPLLSRMVRQVVADYRKGQKRYYSRYIQNSSFEELPLESGPSPWVQEWLEALLDTNSPLDKAEKEFLNLILEAPSLYIRKDGRPQKSVLARRLNVTHATVGRRWTRIKEKVSEWKSRY